MVHSPISVHSETRAHSTSHSIRGGTNNTRLSPYYWPMGPVLSAEDIDHGPSFLAPWPGAMPGDHRAILLLLVFQFEVLINI